MIPIEEQLLEFIEVNSKEIEVSVFSILYPDFRGKINTTEIVTNFRLRETKIYNCVIDYIEFDEGFFEGVIFQNVSFVSCNFTSSIFKNCRFEKVLFERLSIYDCEFLDCVFDEIELENIDLLQTNFKGVEHYRNIQIVESYISNTIFWGGSIFNLRISQTVYGSNALTFKNINLSDCFFTDNNLNTSCFDSCTINYCSFINCVFDKTTFLISCEKFEEGINHIDLQTILHSTFNDTTYQLFGINKNSDAKEYISAITKEVKFQSVFISYSFKDSNFARYLNEKMRHKGINTFLWEHDAPGGKRLKKIMQEYIRKHDRVLFIASCDSLKSQACHFELSEARTIQDKEWKDVYYPIHIDDYLFQVQKDDIRPKEYREEYWKNIEEILDFNSLPFIEYKDSYHNNPAFEEQVDNLVKNLKI